MRVLLVVNSAASSVTARRRVIVQRILGEDCDLYTAETRRRGHATALARAAVRNGTDAVVVLGGDGTLNEVATALAGTRCALAALPGGSTNVFARTIGLPDDPVRAAAVVAASLRSGSIEPIGLGEVDGRFFCFHTGIGWDAALVEIVERHAELKRYAGHPLFILAGLRTFLGGYDRRRSHFSVTFDDGEVIEDAYFTLVMNSDPYTFVGSRPFTLSPVADLHHPLSVLTFTRLHMADFLPVVVDALADRHGVSARRHLRIRTGVRSLRVERRTTMPYQVDGDHLGEVDRLVFHHHPDAVGLVVPEERRAAAAARGRRAISPPARRPTPGGPSPGRW